MEGLQEAVLWAAHLHQGQWRDGDDPLPYITHPFEVLSMLRHIGGVTDESMLCVAALHDTVEECDVTLEDVGKRFGKRVEKLLAEVTREEPTEEQAAGLSSDELWALRSRMLLDEIRGMSRGAKQIKLADRLSNVRGAFASKKGKKLARYLEQTEQILEIVKREVNPPLWDAIRAELKAAN